MAPTTGPPRSSTTRPASAAARGSRTSPASSPAASKSASSTRGATPPPEKARRTLAPGAAATATAKLPSGRVVDAARGFACPSRRASRRASSKPSSNGSTATSTAAEGLPSTRTRPRISPAEAGTASAARATAWASGRMDMWALLGGKVRRSLRRRRPPESRTCSASRIQFSHQIAAVSAAAKPTQARYGSSRTPPPGSRARTPRRPQDREPQRDDADERPARPAARRRRSRARRR